METRARAHKQTTCPGYHPRSTPQNPMFRTSSRARGFIRGWIQTAWRMDALPKKSHQRSQSTGCVLVRKAPTTLTQSGNSTVDSPQSGNSPTGQKTEGASKVDRDGDSGNSLRQSVSPLGQAVRSSWGPVTVCPTTSIWFTHASHFHTRIPGGSSPTTESLSSVVVLHHEVCQTKPLL